MRTTAMLAALAGAGFFLAGSGRADVIVDLKSGATLRAVRTWTEGDVVNVQLRTGVVGFPPDAIKSIREATSSDDSPERPPARAQAAPPGGDSALEVDDDEIAPAVAPPPAQAAAEPPPPLTVDEHVPDVPREDAKTKMERLDHLSLETHRQLSIARTQGQPQATLDALRRKIDEINRQRDATLKRISGSH